MSGFVVHQTFETYQGANKDSRGGVTIPVASKWAVARVVDGGVQVIAHIPDYLPNPEEMAKTIVHALGKAGFRSDEHA